MNHLVIRNGVIENIIVLDPESNWQAPEGTLVVPFGGVASIGWAWDGSNAIDPNPPQLEEEDNAD